METSFLFDCFLEKKNVVVIYQSMINLDKISWIKFENEL